MMRCIAKALDALINRLAPLLPLPVEEIGAELLAEFEEDDEVWEPVGEYFDPEFLRPDPPA